ncbi:MAG: class I SAM-dependent methyltransferase [Burkholderiaceae bacterium]|nr:class I SAM-dependent methyltransferase [Burkholderiaceae bacterium]
MSVLPPGTILQLMYLKERLTNIPPGRFIEVGPGAGEISRLLLQLGWEGISYDLEPRTIQLIRRRFSREISAGRYDAETEDFLSIDEGSLKKVNLIISCMVIEHLSDDMADKFMQRSSDLLCDDGLMIGFVPSSPAHWGIEDDIAGHYRRYTRDSVLDLTGNNGYEVRHLAGLTYPISNILLPISNFLVRRAEKSKLLMSEIEKTKASGIRDVRFKTTFPSVLSLVLNRFFLLPLYWLQKAFSSSSNSLVLYFEAVPQQLKTKGQ